MCFTEESELLGGKRISFSANSAKYVKCIHSEEKGSLTDILFHRNQTKIDRRLHRKAKEKS